MVLPDVSSNSNSDSSNYTALARRGAPLTDRMLAFGFDLCLWTPLALLLTKPLWRDFHYHQVLSPGSTEALMFFGFGLFFSLMFLVAVQTLCVWKWGATPGKRIFMLEVVKLDGGRLSLGQSLTRSLTLIFEFLCLAIPLLEVVSHTERRPWHDRLAESRVITRKTKTFEAPHALETRFFRNLYWGFGLSMMILAWSGLWQMHRQVKVGALKRGELQEAGYLCEQKTKIAARAGMTPAQARIDFMLAQFEAGVVEKDCLQAEADFAIWTQSEELLPWANLVRGVLNQVDGKDSISDPDTASYFAKACGAEPTSLLCELSAYFQGQVNGEPSDATWTGQVVQLKQAVERGEFDQVEVLAMRTSWPQELAGYVQDVGLRSLFLRGAQAEFEAGMKLLAPAWTTSRRHSNLAWACFSETTKACGQSSSPKVCRDLRIELETAGGEAWTAPMSLTFAMEASCFNRKDVIVENELKKHFASDEKMAWVFELSQKQKSSALLATLQNTPKDHWARAYLLWWAGRGQKAATDDLALEFQKTPRTNADWWVAYQSFDTQATPAVKELNRRGLSSVQEEDEKE